MRAVTALLLVASSACAHATLDQARAAYADGDLRRSQTLLANVQPSSDAEKRALAELSKSVTADKKRVIDSLLADAGRARGRADEGVQGYSEVIGYYQAALALLSGGEAQVKTVTSSLRHAEAAQTARQASFANARRKFEENGKCTGAQQRDRLAELWALRRACDSQTSLVPLAQKAAEVCAKVERYDDALQLRAVLDDATRADGARATLSLDEWPAETRGWFALVEIRAQERALRTATTTASSTATFGPATAAREDRHRPAKPTTTTPSRTQATQTSATIAVANGRAEVILTRARKLYDGGSVFDALLALDAGLSEDLTGGDRAKLDQQETVWSPDRNRLIDEYLRRGENALREEQIESAYAWYQRILTLDPSHEIAQDRVRRLDRLKSMKSGGPQ